MSDTERLLRSIYTFVMFRTGSTPLTLLLCLNKAVGSIAERDYS